MTFIHSLVILATFVMMNIIIVESTFEETHGQQLTNRVKDNNNNNNLRTTNQPTN